MGCTTGSQILAHKQLVLLFGFYARHGSPDPKPFGFVRCMEEILHHLSPRSSGKKGLSWHDGQENGNYYSGRMGII